MQQSEAAKHCPLVHTMSPFEGKKFQNSKTSLLKKLEPSLGSPPSTYNPITNTEKIANQNSRCNVG
jgi:hypothetical protein